jgi:lipoyl(octanoyl) transferase
MWSVSIKRHSDLSPFRFQDLLQEQEVVLARLREKKESALLFAEVAPVITVGRRQLQDESEKKRLEKLGIEIVSGERGGNETWHGPGQWVGFVLTPLEVFTGDTLGVRKAVYKILRHTLAIVRLYLPEAILKEGAELGIWSGHGKLVSVGIRIKNGYVTSGFAMNCISTPKAFLGISPCGIDQAKPDFIFQNLSKVTRDAEFLKLPQLITAEFSK